MCVSECVVCAECSLNSGNMRPCVYFSLEITLNFFNRTSYFPMLICREKKVYFGWFFFLTFNHLVAVERFSDKGFLLLVCLCGSNGNECFSGYFSMVFIPNNDCSFMNLLILCFVNALNARRIIKAP